MRKWDLALIIISSIALIFSIVDLILSCTIGDYKLIILDSLLIALNTSIVVTSVLEYIED